MGRHVDFAHVEAGEDGEAGWWRSCCLAVVPVGDVRCNLYFIEEVAAQHSEVGEQQ